MDHHDAVEAAQHPPFRGSHRAAQQRTEAARLTHAEGVEVLHHDDRRRSGPRGTQSQRDQRDREEGRADAQDDLGPAPPRQHQAQPEGELGDDPPEPRRTPWHVVPQPAHVQAPVVGGGSALVARGHPPLGVVRPGAQHPHPVAALGEPRGGAGRVGRDAADLGGMVEAHHVDPQTHVVRHACSTPGSWNLALWQDAEKETAAPVGSQGDRLPTRPVTVLGLRI